MSIKNIYSRIYKISFVILVFSFIAVHRIDAQNYVDFQNKTIVCLTYDDCLDVHLDKVIPALDSFGFKGTFYIPGNSACLNNRMEEWRNAAKNGHELGNHTLFHPCFGKSMKRDWVGADYDLDIYSMQRIVDEIKTTNTLLKAIDGKSKRTFAYTCGDKKIGDENIWDKIKDEFVAARGVNGIMYSIKEVDVSEIGSYAMNNNSGEEMIDLVKQAMKNNSLMVFLFHGVGGGHSINVALEEHNKLLSFLKENEKNICVATFLDAASYVKEHK
jgi:peptidoglycan-N-acetylglucosamine deacetylase